MPKQNDRGETVAETRDLLAERPRGQSPRAITLAQDESGRDKPVQVCLFDCGASEPNVILEAFLDARSQGLIHDCVKVPKRSEEGEYILLIASQEQLIRFNQSYRLSEATRFKGGDLEDHPAWAKNERGEPLHRWLGIND